MRIGIQKSLRIQIRDPSGQEKSRSLTVYNMSVQEAYEKIAAALKEEKGA